MATYPTVVGCPKKSSPPRAQLLGHRSIQSNFFYVTIGKALFKTQEDQRVKKVAHDIKEAQKLVEVGFEFHCDFGVDWKLFRKRE